MSDCPFCDYMGPSKVIASNVDAFVIEPLNPVAPGHELVIPFAHVEALHELNPRQLGGVAVLAAARSREARQKVGAVNVIVNTGAAASQTIPHLHAHIVPRREGDGLALPWSAQKVEST